MQLCLVFRKILYLQKIFYHYYFLSYFEMTREKITWGTYFAIYPFIKFSISRTPFCLVMFCLLRFLFYCIFFWFLSNFSLLCLNNIFYQIFFLLLLKWIRLCSIFIFECVRCNYIFTMLHFHLLFFYQIPRRNHITLPKWYIFVLRFNSLLF